MCPAISLAQANSSAHRGAASARYIKHNPLEAGSVVWEEMFIIRLSYLFIPFMRSASTKSIMINGTFANYLLSADEKSATCELP